MKSAAIQLLAFLLFSYPLVYGQEATIDAIEGAGNETPQASQGGKSPSDVVDRFKAGSPTPISLVRVRLLDKISCQYLHALLHVERLYAFGRLRILVLKAFENPAEEYPEVYALLKIWEIPLFHAEFGPKKGTAQEIALSPEKDVQEAEKTLVFSGWMFASSPAVAPLEHPVYDVRLEQNQDDKPAEALAVKGQHSALFQKGISLSRFVSS